MIGIEDETLFGWDSTPGIVSVWADQEGMVAARTRISKTKEAYLATRAGHREAAYPKNGQPLSPGAARAPRRRAAGAARGYRR